VALKLLRFVLLLVVVLVSGCALAGPSDPTPEPDWVQVRVYTNGGERMPESVRWRFHSADSPDQEGVVTWIPEANCIFIGRGWTLRVTTQVAGDDPILNALAASRNFSGESPLDLAIERTADGRVTVSEGLPDWWEGPPIGCASN
jgi:hypothetical protein